MIPGQGSTFGRFKIVSVLGRGATGVVLHAIDSSLGDRPVALKLLHGGDRASHEQIERLRREAEALARVNHPNVVRVYEAGSHDGVRYVALELVEGEALLKVFERPGALETKLRLIEQTARGVHAAHRVGVIHRDLKPANVLVDRDGRARVVDFGLARVEDVSIALTKTGAAVGTPFYMAPESARGAASEISPATDVFSLGCMLFEAVTGESPYEKSASFGTLIVQLTNNEPVRRASAVNPGIPVALDEVCARALAKSPTKRYASAAEFADALAAAHAAGPGRTRRRLPWRAAAVFTGALLTLALTGIAHPWTLLSDASPVPSASPAAIEIVWREPTPDTVAPEGRVIRVAGRCSHARELTGNGRPLALKSSGEFDGAVPIGPDGEIVLVAKGEGLPPVELHRRLHGREGMPAWLRAVPEADRPPLPLPRGVVFSETAGEYVNEVDGSILVFVPGGAFEMGSMEGEDRERPVHRVTLSPYFVGKLDVTNEQFACFTSATHFVTDAEREGFGTVTATWGTERRQGCMWRDPGGEHEPLEAGHPVIQVSWNDAFAYATWAGLTLPSEAQWERAAGWDKTTRHMRRYAWGDAPASAVSRPVGNVADESLRALFPRGQLFPRTTLFEGYDDGYLRTSPVGHFPEGASPVGALDMTGNVSNWCLDSYDVDSYMTLPEHDPLSARVDPVFHSIRGSCWADGPPASRVAHRSRAAPSDRGNSLGFRVALPLSRD